MELSPTRARFAVESLGLDVRLSTFESDPSSSPVEAVCAFHVLEHVDDPQVFLEAAGSRLVPGGWVAIEVPNIASAGARRLGKAWPGLALDFHRWHFSPRSLIRLVKKVGFVPYQCDTVLARYYTRPRSYVRLATWRTLAAECRSARSTGLVHPALGDHLRLIARLPGGATR